MDILIFFVVVRGMGLNLTVTSVLNTVKNPEIGSSTYQSNDGKCMDAKLDVHYDITGTNESDHHFFSKRSIEQDTCLPLPSQKRNESTHTLKHNESALRRIGLNIFANTNIKLSVTRDTIETIATKHRTLCSALYINKTAVGTMMPNNKLPTTMISDSNRNSNNTKKRCRTEEDDVHLTPEALAQMSRSERKKFREKKRRSDGKSFALFGAWSHVL